MFRTEAGDKRTKHITTDIMDNQGRQKHTVEAGGRVIKQNMRHEGISRPAC